MDVPETQGTRYVAQTQQFKILLYSDMAIRWRLTDLVLNPDYFETRPLKLNSTIFLLSTQAGFISSTIFHFFSDYRTTLKININNQEEKKQFDTAGDEEKTAKRAFRAVSKVGNEAAAIMAIHLGKQERLSTFAHCAVIFCRIAGGPKQH